ncbi:ABC transporter permease [Micromonospora schwarzwaldensis]|uniref:ABC transporter permease n=1 Tax=Micromonospora sp. DSM 45708 TaxID=3111767 RepID=UPI0031D50704
MTAHLRVLPVFRHHLAGYRRTWRGSLSTSFVVPLLFMTVVGTGLTGDVTVGDTVVPYLRYFVPGMIMSGALTITFTESTWPVYSGFRWTRIYEGMATTSLRSRDILLGHVCFVMLRAGLSASVFVIVASILRAVPPPDLLILFPLVMLLALSCANPLFALAARARSDATFRVVFRLGVVPLQLFSGVFFPVEHLPWGLALVAWISPLWHALEAYRELSLGQAGGTTLLHVGYLLLWVVVGWRLAARSFARVLHR